MKWIVAICMLCTFTVLATAQQPLFVPNFWRPVNSPTDSAANPLGLRVYYAPVSGTLFGTNELGIFRSVDRGDSWQLVSDRFKGTWIQAFRETNRGTLLIGGSNFKTYRSTDAGVTWSEIPSLPSYPVISFWTDGGPYLYAGIANGGLYRSVDDGLTWAQSSNGLPADHWVQSLIRLRNGELLVSTALNGIYGIYRSSDNGDSWALSNTGIESALTWDLAEASPGVVLAGTMKSGLFRSVDTGRTWASIGPYYPDSNRAEVQHFLVDGSGYVYASSGYLRGPYLSTDGGRDWYSIRSGLDILDFGYITIDAQGYLYTNTRTGTYRSTERAQPVLAVREAVASKLNAPWPNPTESSIHLDRAIFKPGSSYLIVDKLGRVVLSGRLPESLSLPVDHLSGGSYTVTAGGAAATFIKR